MTIKKSFFNYDLDLIQSNTRLNSAFILVVPTKSGFTFKYKFVFKNYLQEFLILHERHLGEVGGSGRVV